MPGRLTPAARAAALVSSIGLLLAVSSSPASAAASTPKPSPSSARPTPLAATTVKAGDKDGGGEPSIAIGPDGTEYISYPGNAMESVISSDGGRTWVKGTSPEAPSGDTSVNVDSSGAVYESNLNGIGPDPNTLQVDIFKSFDHGRTWPRKGQSALQSSNSSGQPFLVDRQWVDSVIPPDTTTNEALVYLEYHDWGPSQIWVSRSPNGGANFDAPVDVINDPAAVAASFCNTIPAGVKVVPYGTNAYGIAYKNPGRVYAAWLAADAANPATGCNFTQGAAFHSVWIAYSDDQGQTWTDKLVYDAGPFHDGSEIFAHLVLDDEGNPYVSFPMNINNEFDAWVSASFDGANSFIKPAKINTNSGTHYFPTIAAGRPGQVVAAYLATPVITPTLPTGKPSPGGDGTSYWRLYMAQTLNLRAKNPTFTNALVTPTPVHYGDICTLGIACTKATHSNRDLLDFIDVALDPAGFAHVAFTGDYGQYQGIYAANQSGGPSLGAPGH